MSIHGRDAGAWSEVIQPSVRRNGAWHPCIAVFVNNAGSWVEAWPAIDRVRLVFESSDDSVTIPAGYDFMDIVCVGGGGGGGGGVLNENCGAGGGGGGGINVVTKLATAGLGSLEIQVGDSGNGGVQYYGGDGSGSFVRDKFAPGFLAQAWGGDGGGPGGDTPGAGGAGGLSGEFYSGGRGGDGGHEGERGNEGTVGGDNDGNSWALGGSGGNYYNSVYGGGGGGGGSWTNPDQSYPYIPGGGNGGIVDGHCFGNPGVPSHFGGGGGGGHSTCDGGDGRKGIVVLTFYNED